MARPSSAEPAKATKRKGTRNMSTLRSSQRARKRANDREAQRVNRATPKETIERLERELEEAKAIQELIRRNKALEDEISRLREAMCFLAGGSQRLCVRGPGSYYYYRYKKVIEPVTVEDLDPKAGKLSLRSHYFFSDLSHLACSWSITVQDKEATEPKGIDLPHVAPGSTEVVQLPAECLSCLQAHSSRDGWLDLSFRLKNDTEWAPAGHEVAWSQVHVPSSSSLGETSNSPSALLANVKAPIITIVPGRLIVSSPDSNAQLIFDLVRGGFKWTSEAGVAVTQGPELSIYRAMTSNDLGFGGDGADWQRCMVDWARSSVVKSTWEQDKDDDAIGNVKVTTEVRIRPPSLSWAVRATLEYVVSASLTVISVRAKGDLERRESASPSPHVLPRIRLDLTLPRSYNRVRWFGRGPGEGYGDKKDASAMGLYRASVEELHVPYEVPQENGSRGDIHWVRLQADQGIGGTPIIEARMVHGPFNFTARKHTAQELDRARHRHELKECDELLLSLDLAHHGLGSGSCGPPPFEAHRLYAEPFDFTTVLRLVDNDESTGT
ncbi:galactose mutarotase-like domain-containing protein [Dactylonectria estremocensis]|uniref:beta-galactosidase n=1 Tax=Dactylonectria estremocensis TaxID=1079267 RepID=A0A9P9ENS9_9HYPO|nr:galactose mutarotase-like domain-containing protein [Dactylonectria estremocensis]